VAQASNVAKARAQSLHALSVGLQVLVVWVWEPVVVGTEVIVGALSLEPKLICQDVSGS
jgi:hypothetical protein